jgi:3-hydroxyisobutyrate dehydrogenase-like beta-hydroxyacid dehydrogenase
MSRLPGAIAPSLRFTGPFMSKRRNKGAVGQVGLGIMGGAFARHLLADGFQVVGYDPSGRAANGLKRAGGVPVRSAAEVAERARVIITSLPSPAAMEAAFFGKQGIAAGARPGTVVIEASTMTLELKESLHRRLAQQGVRLLDCPISGTGAQAAAKDIIVYASGDRGAFNRHRKVFDGFARGTYYCGEFGTGSKLKFVANLLVTVHNLSTAEAMVMGEKAGLDLDLLFRVIADGAGSSRMFQVRGPLMAKRDYSNPTMKLDVWQKDMTIIADFARQLGCQTPLFAATGPIYTAARAMGGQQDTAAVCAVLEKMSGGTLGKGQRAKGRRQRAKGHRA